MRNDLLLKSGLLFILLAITPVCMAQPPQILVPFNDQAISQGCNNTNLPFFWTPVNGATMYQLYVQDLGLSVPAINITTTDTTYLWQKTGNILSENNTNNWECKVRAYANGVWSNYSNVVIFHLSPPSCDSGLPPAWFNPEPASESPPQLESEYTWQFGHPPSQDLQAPKPTLVFPPGFATIFV